MYLIIYHINTDMDNFLRLIGKVKFGVILGDANGVSFGIDGGLNFFILGIVLVCGWKGD